MNPIVCTSLWRLALPPLSPTWPHLYASEPLEHSWGRSFNQQPLTRYSHVQPQRSLREREVGIRRKLRREVYPRRLVDPSVRHPLFRYHETSNGFFQSLPLRVQIPILFLTENGFSCYTHQLVNFQYARTPFKRPMR